MHAKPSHYNTNKGFALIELIVSIGLFLIVASLSSGAIVNLFYYNKSSKNLEIMNSNIEMIMEDISRNARVATQFYCSSSNTPPSSHSAQDCNNGVLFGYKSEPFLNDIENKTEIQTVYFYKDGDMLKKSVKSEFYFGSSKVKEEQVVSTINAQENVIIESFIVNVEGAKTGDAIQPFATISIRGKIRISSQAYKSVLYQTSVTQRLFNI